MAFCRKVESMTIIILNGIVVIAYTGPCPDQFKEARLKALKGEDGYSIAKGAFAEYLEGDLVVDWDFNEGKRLKARPVVEPTTEELYSRELNELKARCLELDRASDRAMRAIVCKTDTASDRAFLQGLEVDVQVKRLRIRELKGLLGLV